MHLPLRTIVAAAALLAGAGVLSATGFAADWRKDYPTVTLGVTSAENQADLLARYKPVQEYLGKALGTTVRVITASDYAGIIEAMKSKKVEMAYFGPASYAKAYEVTGGNVEPVAVQTDDLGIALYMSVIVVKVDSPYKTIQDLKGKTLAWADPNSTSGFQVPNYYLRQQGIVPEQFFAKAGFGGSHENSVLAVLNGTYDAAATWYRNEQRNNFKRMADKNMIPQDAVRIVWQSPKLPESPWTLQKSLPAAMKADITRHLLALPSADPAAWKALTDGKSKDLAPVTHEHYIDVIKLIKENERLCRTQS